MAYFARSVMRTVVARIKRFLESVNQSGMYSNIHSRSLILLTTSCLTFPTVTGSLKMFFFSSLNLFLLLLSNSIVTL